MDAIAPLSPASSTARVAPPADVAQKFEALVLSNFVETMLPKDGTHYGGGTGADIWRSQLAQAIGAQLAKADALGLSGTLGIEP